MTVSEQRDADAERSPDAIAAALRTWLGERVDADGPMELTVAKGSETSGFSSDCLLFDAAWSAGGSTHSGSFVARTAPVDTRRATFSRYDMGEQYRVMQTVARATDVPMPRLHWLETDASVLGSPFFVMDRVPGQVPADNPPYLFQGWLLEARAPQRRVLQDASIGILARVHAMADPENRLPYLAPRSGSALRSHFEAQRAYYDWALVADGIRIPLLERTFDWLRNHWPDEQTANVLNWGDARIGNIIYSDFEPKAVIDWEMAAIGPRELDLGWFIFFHRFFQDIAEQMGLPGMPGFLQRAEVVAAYERRASVKVAALDFFLVYAALRHAIIMARIKRRMIHLGQDTQPAEPDDFVLHRAMLERMLAGTYTWD